MAIHPVFEIWADDQLKHRNACRKVGWGGEGWVGWETWHIRDIHQLIIASNPSFHVTTPKAAESQIRRRYAPSAAESTEDRQRENGTNLWRCGTFGLAWTTTFRHLALKSIAICEPFSYFIFFDMTAKELAVVKTIRLRSLRERASMFFET